VKRFLGAGAIVKDSDASVGRAKRKCFLRAASAARTRAPRRGAPHARDISERHALLSHACKERWRDVRTNLLDLKWYPVSVPHTRLGHLKGIFGPWWFGVNLFWTAVSSADVFVSHYASPSFKIAWDQAWITPRWGWTVWLVGFVLISSVFTFEYSFRHIKKYETEAAERESVLRSRLDEETAKRKVPHVIVDCDWPSTQGVEVPGVVTIRDRKLTLRNLNDVPAFDVQIQPIERNGVKATFAITPRLEKDSPTYAKISIEGTSPVMARDFENVLQRDWKNLKLDVDDVLQKIDIRVPLIIRFKDVDGTIFESMNELEYDLYSQEGQIRFKGIRKL